VLEHLQAAGNLDEFLLLFRGELGAEMVEWIAI